VGKAIEIGVSITTLVSGAISWWGRVRATKIIGKPAA
jgi:hypothetical protein